MTATDARLAGRVAVITGMASGIGRAGLVSFVCEGAKVVGVDIDDEAGEAAVDAVSADRLQASFVGGDASDSDVIKAAVATAVRKFGKLDLLWANAGIGLWKDVVTTSEAEWDRVVATNLKSAYLLAHYGIPEVIRAGGGTMVLTGSINSFVGAQNWAAYSATKGAILALCKAMALDYASANVRINCVCPGSIRTSLLNEEYALAQPGIAEQADIANHPLGRIGHAEEVAEAALFLSSAASSFTTGSALLVDGGFTAR